MHFPSSSTYSTLFNTCYVLFPYAWIQKGQGFVFRYIFTAVYSFYPLFVKRNFVVCRRVSDKLGYAEAERSLRNSLDSKVLTAVYNRCSWVCCKPASRPVSKL
jgi:hypothetical protein